MNTGKNHKGVQFHIHLTPGLTFFNLQNKVQMVRHVGLVKTDHRSNRFLSYFNLVTAENQASVNDLHKTEISDSLNGLPWQEIHLIGGG